MSVQSSAPRETGELDVRDMRKPERHPAIFAAYGGLLLVCAWAITHGGAWARGPILLAQLIQLGLAWNLRGGETTLVAVVIGIVALVAIAGIVHPQSIEALESQR